jgi:mono/diheme cytochrome c family protein
MKAHRCQRRSWLRIVPLAVLLLSAIVVADNPDDWQAPARAARKKNPIPADQKSIATGKDVYAKQCFSCHGSQGKGDGPASKDLNPRPHDLGAPNVAAQSDGALFWKITEGKKPMPSFEKLISEDDRWHVINYVRTLAPPTTQP